MTQRPLLRSGTALVLALFANATFTGPGLEAAGLMSGVQRYGLDQDGNVVPLAAPAGTGRSAAYPTEAAPPAAAARRYGVDQNGEIRPLAAAPRSPAAAPPLTASAQPPAPSIRLIPGPLPPVPSPGLTPSAQRQGYPGIVARVTAKLKQLMAAESGGARTASAKPIPSPESRVPSPGLTASPQSRVPSPGLTGLTPRPQSRVPSPGLTGLTPRPRSPVPGPGRYTLKIDPLKVRTAAGPVAAKLAQQGIPVVESRPEHSPVEIYRLVVDTFATQQEAQECLRRVQPKLKTAYLISLNGRHGVYCGSYYLRETAEEKQALHRGSGVPLTIQRDSVRVRRDTILAGAYLTRDDALADSRRLNGLGIPAAIIPGDGALAGLKGQRRLKS